MKILHITPSYKPAYRYGGPIVSVAKLCEVLASNSIDVEVLTTKANGQKELEVSTHLIVDGVKVTYFKRVTKDHTHFSPALLWRLLILNGKAKSRLIIHIHSWWNLVAITSCLIAKIKKIPVVLSPRGMLTTYTLGSRSSLYKKLIHLIIGRSLIRYCVIHATTDMEKDDILKVANPKNVLVIPNLVYFKAQNPEPCIRNVIHQSTKPFRLLFFSRIEKKKGLELLFTALADCDFPWELTVAGNGERSYISTLKKLAGSLGISSTITWIGLVNKETKYDVLSDHQLLVLFSHNENFGNVILESLSVGTAVAISDKVGLSSLVNKHNLGWVSPLNTEMVAQTLRDARASTQELQKIRGAAPEIIHEHFNDDRLVNQYIQLYKNIR